jgi:hypothetical protein
MLSAPKLGCPRAMPIRPKERWFYPVDWPQLSAVIRFTRAKGQCEHCGRPHGKLVCHLGDGRWYDEAAGTWRNGHGRPLRSLPKPELLSEHQRRSFTRVFLACAHLNHNPTDNRSRNLAGLRGLATSRLWMAMWIRIRVLGGSRADRGG